MSRRRVAFRLILALVILGTAAFFIYTKFFVKMVRVPTGSMLNTIVPGDSLVVHRLFGAVHRGDIITFQYPGDKALYIARVIGLPGEAIQLKGRLIYINGTLLDEQRVLVDAGYNGKEPLKELSTEGSGPYRVYYVEHSFEEDDSSGTSGDIAVETPFQIPADSYFILGDNRDNSNDSRFRGAVPRNLIWGKASMIYYSESPSAKDEIRWERMFKKVQ